MKILKLFALTLLMILIAQGKSFAAMPEISAGETSFDFMRGAYVLKNNVYVKVDNHGFAATVTADEAVVSLVEQKCWADGNVKLKHDDVDFGCEHAYMYWQDKLATVVGSVNFQNKNFVTITSDTAVFNWDTKIVDFYGDINLKTESKVKLAKGIKQDGKKYQHIQYNIAEGTILALDKNFDIPNIEIPTQNQN
ncbi:MAG: hypothetical protein K6G55_00610 [Selenomonadaceae bacterium]|nr:hypothetical protein [Selenomonadaceae bacterium]